MKIPAELKQFEELNNFDRECPSEKPVRPTPRRNLEACLTVHDRRRGPPGAEAPRQPMDGESTRELEKNKPWK